MANECILSEDCPRPQICFRVLGGSTSCRCSALYGWQGENCDEESAYINYQRIIVIIDVMCAVVLLILIGRTMSYNIKLSPKFWQEKIDPVYITGVLIFCSSLCLLIYGFLELVANFNPNFFEVKQYRSAFNKNREYEQFSVKGGITETVFLLVYLSCLSFSTFFLTESWERVLNKVRRFISPNRGQRLRRNLYYFLLLGYFIFVVVFVFIEDLQSLAIGTLLAFIINTVIFCGRAYRFNSILQELQVVSDKRGLATVNLIRKIVIIDVICSIFIVIFALIFVSTINKMNENDQPGSFNYSFLFRDLAIFTGIICEGSIAWYINSTTEGVILTEDLWYCQIFWLWDRKNLEIFPDEYESYEQLQIDEAKKKYSEEDIVNDRPSRSQVAEIEDESEVRVQEESYKFQI